MSSSAASPSPFRRLLDVHDAATTAGFWIAGACLAAIVCSYVIEVVLRYFLNAPTSWAGSAVSYLLCVSIFLVLPELTRQRSHIFISVLPDALSQQRATLLVKSGYLAGLLASMLAAWFCADATYTQYVNQIETLNEWRVPKWTVSIFIPYGLASSGLYFLRHVVASESYVAAGSGVA